MTLADVAGAVHSDVNRPTAGGRQPGLGKRPSSHSTALARSERVVSTLDYPGQELRWPSVQVRRRGHWLEHGWQSFVKGEVVQNMPEFLNHIPCEAVRDVQTELDPPSSTVQ